MVDLVMHAPSQQIIGDLVPDLARAFRGAVPQRCFVVRVQDEWLAHDTGATRIQTADFSPADDEPWVEELCAAVADQLATRYANRLPDDPEHARVAFADGTGCVRVWPQRALLLTEMMEVVRLDHQQAGSEEAPSSLVGDHAHVLEKLDPVEIQGIKRETFVAIGDDLPGGEKLTVRLVVKPDVAQHLRGFGFQLDAATSTWRRGTVSVRLPEPTRALVEIES